MAPIMCGICRKHQYSVKLENPANGLSLHICTLCYIYFKTLDDKPESATVIVTEITAEAAAAVEATEAAETTEAAAAAALR
jgi:hypothetical protein